LIRDSLGIVPSVPALSIQRATEYLCRPRPRRRPVAPSCYRSETAALRRA
jgi:hypothetical protein